MISFLVCLNLFVACHSIEQKQPVISDSVNQEENFKTNSESQAFYTGYEYVLNDNDFYPFKYTRSYSGSGNEFVTTYTIYHPTKGYAAYTVTATHFKTERKVVVSIDDAGGGLLAHINSEETTYETPSLTSFGFRGAVGALGGNRVPNQLYVKFVSEKFENVKVIHVNATEPGSNDFIFYVLDEKN